MGKYYKIAACYEEMIELAHQKLQNFKGKDLRLNLLSNERLGKIIAAVGEVDNDFFLRKRRSRYHRIGELFQKPINKKSKYSDKGIRIKAKATARAFLFLDPTSEMFETVCRFCNCIDSEFEFAPGHLIFNKKLEVDRGSLLKSNTQLVIPIKKILADFSNSKCLLMYAVFGILTPEILETTLVTKYFADFLLSVAPDYATDTLLLKGVTKDAYEIQIKMPGSKNEGEKPRWKCHYKSETLFNEQLIASIKRTLFNYLFLRTQNWIKNSISEIKNEIPNKMFLSKERLLSNITTDLNKVEIDLITAMSFQLKGLIDLEKEGHISLIGGDFQPGTTIIDSDNYLSKYSIRETWNWDCNPFELATELGGSARKSSIPTNILKYLPHPIS